MVAALTLRKSMQRPPDHRIPLTLANEGAKLAPFHVNLEHAGKEAVSMKLLVEGDEVHRDGHRLLITAIDDGGNPAGSAGLTRSAPSLVVDAVRRQR